MGPGDPNYPGMGSMMQPPPPGLMSTGLQSAGFGAPLGLEYQQSQLAAQQFSSTAGLQTTAAISNIPSFALGAAGLAGAFGAPILMAQQSAGLRALGRGLNYFDPFAYMLPAANTGAAFGAGGMRAGMTALRTGAGGMGAIGGALNAGRFGAAAMGLGAGLGAFALTGAAIYGATEAVAAAGRQVFRGAAITLQGQATASQMALPVQMQQAQAASGGQLGFMMQDMGRQMRIGQEGVAQLANMFDDLGTFQTTSDMREFREKFKSMLDTVKDISRTMQQTVEDAGRTFAELRQQGFYTAADVRGAATRQAGISLATGMSAQQVSAVGQVGAQTARAMGMRGRFGSDFFTESVSNISQGLRSGAFDEEMVMELGGPEAAGMQLAQAQMRFLRSRRGRMMIANAMQGSEGFGMDPDRLARIMGGDMSMEQLVTGAAGRGLGILRGAGMREARENFAPYAGMAMVQAAMAQERQLSGGRNTAAGTIRMLMNVAPELNRESAELLLRQQLNAGDALAGNLAGQETARSRAAEIALRKQSSFIEQTKANVRQRFSEPLRGFGSDMMRAAQGMYNRLLTNTLGFRTREFAVGGAAELELARDFDLDAGPTPIDPNLDFSGSRRYSEGFFGTGFMSFGNETAATRIRSMIPSNRVVPRNQRLIDSGAYRDIGDGEMVQERILQGVLSGLGAAPDTMNETEQARLSTAINTGDLRSRFERERRGVTGMLGSMSRNERRDFETYFLAKQIGRISAETTFREFMNDPEMTTEGRVRMHRMFADEFAGLSSERQRGIMSGVTDGSLASLASLDATRNAFSQQLGDFMSAANPAQPGMFMAGGMGLVLPTLLQGAFGTNTSFEGADLKTRLEQDPKARLAFRNLLDAYLQDGLTSEVQQEGARAEAQRVLGDDYAAVDTMLQNMGVGTTGPMTQEQQAYRSRLAAQWMGESGTGEDGLRNVFAARSHYEIRARQMGRAVSRLRGRDISQLEGATEGQRRTIQRMFNAAQGTSRDSIREFVGASRELIGDLAGDGFTQRDAMLLNDVFGDARGSSIQQVVAGLQSSERGVRERTLAGLGFTDQGRVNEILSDLRSSSAADRNRGVAAALMEGAGGDLIAGLVTGKGTTTAQGVQAQYIEANRDFVSTVQLFVSTVAAVLDNDKLRDAAADMTVNF